MAFHRRRASATRTSRATSTSVGCAAAPTTARSGRRAPSLRRRPGTPSERADSSARSISVRAPSELRPSSPTRPISPPPPSDLPQSPSTPVRRQGTERCPAHAATLTAWAYFEMHQGKSATAQDLLRRAEALDKTAGELYHVKASSRPNGARTPVDRRPNGRPPERLLIAAWPPLDHS